MKIPNDNLVTIFIDIDGTIMDNNGILFNGAIECIQNLSKKVNIYIWSAGGFNYALDTINNLKLDNYVCGALPKPDYTIDDLNIKTDFGQNIYPDWGFIKEFEKHLEGQFNQDTNLLK